MQHQENNLQTFDGFQLVVLRCHPAPAQSFRIYIVACLPMTLITANMKYE
jgi:hypothetical protein